MEPFALSGLLGALTCIGFGLLVLFKGEDRKLAKVWFLFNCSAAVWCLSVLVFATTKNQDTSINAFKWGYGVGVTWIAILFLHFTYLLIGKVNKRFLLSQYLIGAIFTPFIFTNLFFKKSLLVFDRFYYSMSGPVHYIYFIWWSSLIIYSHYLMIRCYLNSNRQKQNQIKYFLFATTIGYLGGSMGYLPSFGLDIYPWGGFCIPLYPIIMSYAILKYQLMDVRVFIRRTALLTAVYIGLLALTTPIIFLIHKQSGGSLTTIFIGTFVVGLIISTGPIVFAFLSRRASYFKENTIAGITHELKSPLSSIQSATNILEDNLVGDKKNSEYLDMIKSNSERLELFIKDLLQVAQIQTTEFSLNKESVYLNELINDVLNRYKAKADLKNLKINFKSDSNITLQVDKEKTKQIYSNLISNAIKFTDAGTINIHLSKDDKNIISSVEDKGRGIAPEHLNQVFNRFYQAHQNQKGTGLGLTIAKAWVEAHGGRIWAESEGEGRGTKISFTLPLS